MPLQSNDFIPKLTQKKDKYHPSGADRVSFLKNGYRIMNAFPFLFLGVILLNVNFGDSCISNEYYFYLTFIIFFLFTLLEVFYLKIHFLTLKGFFILNALILFFGIWNYIILAFHAENQSFNYSIDNYILNILVNIGLFITVLLFGIVQLVNSKFNKKNKK